jgi:nitrogen fixation protein NifX
LKEAADGEFKEMPQSALKAAVARLRGEEAPPEPALPPVQAASDEPGGIRVACASNNGTELDGHFGSCARFMVYQVSAGDIRLIGIRDTVGDSQAEEKNEFRADLIADCQVLYVASIGGPAAAKVVKRGIHPIKFPQGGFLSSLLKNLQDTLKRNPPPWLAKAMGVSAEERARFNRPSAES